MGNNVTYIEIPPEVVINSVDDPIEKKIIERLIDLFASNGKMYKVTTNFSIHVNIKGKLSVCIATRIFSVQIRIKNPENFQKLNEFSDNVRKQILNAEPCKRCTQDSGEFMGHDEHIFVFQNKEYRKCKLWGNFKFCDLMDDDIDSLIDIVAREISFGKTKRVK